MRPYQAMVAWLMPILAVSRALPSTLTTESQSSEHDRDVFVRLALPCPECSPVKEDQLILDLHLAASHSTCASDHLSINGDVLKQVWDGTDAKGAGSLRGILSESLIDQDVQAEWKSICVPAQDGEFTQIISLSFERAAKFDTEHSDGFTLSFQPGPDPTILRFQHGLAAFPSDESAIKSWTNPSPEEAFKLVALSEQSSLSELQSEIKALHTLRQEFSELQRQIKDKKSSVRKLLKQDLSTFRAKLRECDSMRCVWNSVVGKVPEVAHTLTSYFQRPMHEPSQDAGCAHSMHPDGLQGHHRHPPSSAGLDRPPHFPDEPDMMDDAFGVLPPEPKPHSPEAFAFGPEGHRPPHTPGDEHVPPPHDDAPHHPRKGDHPPPPPFDGEHPQGPPHDGPHPPPPPSGDDHPPFDGDRPPPPPPHHHEDHEHPPHGPPHGDRPFPPPPPPHHGQHPSPPPPTRPPPEKHPRPSRDAFMPPPFAEDRPPLPAGIPPPPPPHHEEHGHHHGGPPGMPHPHHRHPVKKALPILVVILAAVLVFSFIRRKILSPQRRADCAFRREERRNRRAYRRAARRHQLSQWWSRHRQPASDADYDEKRAYVVDQEDVLEDAMQAEIRDLQRAHEMVGEMVRAREGRERLYRLANTPPHAGGMTPAELEAGVGSSSYTETEDLPPPRYSEDLGSDLRVVDGFMYTPSGTDETPDSSVVDCSPRLSLETSRTRASSNATKDGEH